MSPRIYMALVAFFVCLCPLTASAQGRRIEGYTVQIAALSTRSSAERLTRGLKARGVYAYSVGGPSYGAKPVYHVRVGNFMTILSANSYAEKLVDSGLLEAYAITAYESPAKFNSIANSNWKIRTLAQKYPGRRFGFGNEVIDVIAAIGSRGWLLLSRDSINLTMRLGNSSLSRELAQLTAVIGSRGWNLNKDVARFLSSSSPVIVARPDAIIANAAPAAPASRATASAMAPEANKRNLITATAPAGPTFRSNIYGPQPRLQGFVEMRSGRMYVTLRNVDTERGFSGVARISLSDDQRQQDVTPIQVALPPDREVSFPVNEATLTNGAWILMVYDQNGAARLIRGASLAPPKAQPQTPGATDSTTIVDQAQQAPPSYVTGVYDATAWTQPQIPPEVQNIETQGVQVVETAPGDAQNGVGPSGVVDAGAANLPNQTLQNDPGPGQVVVTPRQIALTKENLTLELVITAQNLIKNVTVTLRAGDFQDVRQVYIPSLEGRVPFLIPAAYASAGIYFEVRDEANRTLASGNSDPRSLTK